MLPAVYSPAEVEARWYAEWESLGAFKPNPQAAKGPFTIVIPPPNVTGILHMGHALNNTLQDILIRLRRMEGYCTLWVPGTDHAGIATQNVVERELAKEGLSRHALGREKFVQRVWEWRERYGSTIVTQLRRLGSSCDWSRERFTMDEGLSRAVQTAFLELHRAGLIYRGFYLVHWCPRCQTALSDEEVVHEQVKGHLWHIRYSEGIVVATTRPETMLGDVAVAVHPRDDRYRSFQGKQLILPLVQRQIQVLADDFVDREFGTGAVKVTPAHDLNDFLMAQRHGLQAIPVIGTDGRMTAQAGSAYAGLDRFECRKKVLSHLEKQGLLVKTEEYVTSIGHCYRCKTVEEPALSPQWFVKMEPLAKLAIEAVERDGMRFVPERWAKVYLDWLRNIRDWCISRQIWWGHRIPAWYCNRCVPLEVVERQMTSVVAGRMRLDGPKSGIWVGPGAPPACDRCGANDWRQDEDVLDTWFSSWLWPFSTLGWPERTEDLKKFYPTSILVTGQDIIFFWVARMVMAGKFFLKAIPFREVCIHGIIRVEGGKKMSKSLGNIIDPLEVIDRMGADALRFSIAHMTSEGQDLYLSEERFLLGRNFANKLWNAARLILEGVPLGTVPKGTPSALTLADRWILSRLQAVIGEVTEALHAYRFNDAARGLYRFLWHEFCDWYLEIAKIQRAEAEPRRRTTTQAIQEKVFETTLRLLHPFMPFITEELRQRFAPDGSILSARWPEPDPSLSDPEAERAFGKLQALITEVREIRATFRVPQREKVDLKVRAAGDSELLTRHGALIERLAGAQRLEVSSRLDRPAGSVAAHLGEWDLAIPLAGLVDLAGERARIEKEIRGLENRGEVKRNRLKDASFRAKAPAEVLAEEEGSLQELERQLARWKESLRQLA